MSGFQPVVMWDCVKWLWVVCLYINFHLLVPFCTPIQNINSTSHISKLELISNQYKSIYNQSIYPPTCYSGLQSYLHNLSYHYLSKRNIPQKWLLIRVSAVLTASDIVLNQSKTVTYLNLTLLNHTFGLLTNQSTCDKIVSLWQPKGYYFIIPLIKSQAFVTIIVT